MRQAPGSRAAARCRRNAGSDRSAGPSARGAFEPGIEVEPQLARQVEIGPLAGRHDDAVERAERARAGRVSAVDGDARPALLRPARPAKPVTSVRRPPSTSALRSLPSLPRAGSWSAAPPPKTRVEVLRRAPPRSCAACRRSRRAARDRAAHSRPNARRRPPARAARIVPRASRRARRECRRRSRSAQSASPSAGNPGRAERIRIAATCPTRR